jgi:hypothetical protein
MWGKNMKLTRKIPPGIVIFSIIIVLNGISCTIDNNNNNDKPPESSPVPEPEITPVPVGEACGSHGECESGYCCDGYCRDVQSDPANCGGCGIRCTNAHGTTACADGSCIPVCDSAWGNCDGDATDGCETSLRTVTDCGACGRECALANASASCSTGTCLIAGCHAGYADCDGNNANGCEYDLDTNPDAATYTHIGEVRGDVDQDHISCTDRGEKWFRIYVSEANSSLSCIYLSATIVLTPSAGTNYDLYVYCDTPSSSAIASSNGGSIPDVVDIRWDEECLGGLIPSASDSGRYIYILVRYFNANTCAPYTLDIYGDTAVSNTTCSEK